jgi:hypothetical protein
VVYSFLTQSGGHDPVTVTHSPGFVVFCLHKSARPIVVPGLRHRVTQRGNRREAIFFEDGDQQLYCDMLGEQLRKFGVGCGPIVLCPIMFISF